jgi:energy-coupling factor transporter ATP-binding protein EcfA2
MLPLLYHPIIPAREREERALKAVDLVGLTPRKDYLSSQLSGGQKQRVAIARALVTDPDIIFADEPTGNLDSASGVAVMDVLQKLNDRGHTIILVTHEKTTAEHAKRIIRLRDGETNMLAGLIRDDERRTLDGIPGLSDIPGLGRLFARNQKTTEQTDIILTLTPHIIRVLDLTEADLRPFRVGRDSVSPLAELPLPVEPPKPPEPPKEDPAVPIKKPGGGKS